MLSIVVSNYLARSKFLPGPDPPRPRGSQTVFRTAGHDVDMKMKNCLGRFCTDRRDDVGRALDNIFDIESCSGHNDPGLGEALRGIGDVSSRYEQDMARDMGMKRLECDMTDALLDEVGWL